MKKLILILMAAGLIWTGLTSMSLAMDVASYKSIAKNTIKEALSGSISDIDKLIADQEKLVALGVQGCKDYAKKDSKYEKLMTLVVDNADKMKAMSLEEIEDKWHNGGTLYDNGIDFDAIDHFGPAISYMDAVVHPATTYIVLTQYKKTKDADLLSQVKDELSEVLEHMDHIH